MNKKITAAIAAMLAAASGVAVDDWMVRGELTETQEQLRVTEDERDQATAQVARLESEANDMRAELGRLATDLSAKHAVAEELRERLGITEQQLENWKAKAEGLAKDGVDLQARLERLNDQVAQGEKAVADARAEKARLEGALKDAIAKGSSEVASLRDALAMAERNEEELEAEVRDKGAALVKFSEVLSGLPMDELATKRAASLAKEIEDATCGKPFGRKDDHDACVNQIAARMEPVADALLECWMRDRDAHDGIATYAGDAKGQYEIVSTSKGKVFVELCSGSVLGTLVARGAVGSWKPTTTHDWTLRSVPQGPLDTPEPLGKVGSLIRGIR